MACKIACAMFFIIAHAVLTAPEKSSRHSKSLTDSAMARTIFNAFSEAWLVASQSPPLSTTSDVEKAVDMNIVNDQAHFVVRYCCGDTKCSLV